jgi:hypothetical protein
VHRGLAFGGFPKVRKCTAGMVHYRTWPEYDLSRKVSGGLRGQVAR